MGPRARMLGAMSGDSSGMESAGAGDGRGYKLRQECQDGLIRKAESKGQQKDGADCCSSRAKPKAHKQEVVRRC